MRTVLIVVSERKSSVVAADLLESACRRSSIDPLRIDWSPTTDGPDLRKSVQRRLVEYCNRFTTSAEEEVSPFVPPSFSGGPQDVAVGRASARDFSSQKPTSASITSTATSRTTTSCKNDLISDDGVGVLPRQNSAQDEPPPVGLFPLSLVAGAQEQTAENEQFVRFLDDLEREILQPFHRRIVDLAKVDIARRLADSFYLQDLDGEEFFFARNDTRWHDTAFDMVDSLYFASRTRILRACGPQQRVETGEDASSDRGIKDRPAAKLLLVTPLGLEKPVPLCGGAGVLSNAHLLAPGYGVVREERYAERRERERRERAEKLERARKERGAPDWVFEMTGTDRGNCVVGDAASSRRKDADALRGKSRQQAGPRRSLNTQEEESLMAKIRALEKAKHPKEPRLLIVTDLDAPVRGGPAVLSSTGGSSAPELLCHTKHSELCLLEELADRCFAGCDSNSGAVARKNRAEQRERKQIFMDKLVEAGILWESERWLIESEVAEAEKKAAAREQERGREMDSKISAESSSSASAGVALRAAPITSEELSAADKLAKIITKPKSRVSPLSENMIVTADRNRFQPIITEILAAPDWAEKALPIRGGAPWLETVANKHEIRGDAAVYRLLLVGDELCAFVLERSPHTSVLDSSPTQEQERAGVSSSSRREKKKTQSTLWDVLYDFDQNSTARRTQRVQDKQRMTTGHSTAEVPHKVHRWQQLRNAEDLQRRFVETLPRFGEQIFGECLGGEQHCGYFGSAFASFPVFWSADFLQRYPDGGWESSESCWMLLQMRAEWPAECDAAVTQRLGECGAAGGQRLVGTRVGESRVSDSSRDFLLEVIGRSMAQIARGSLEETGNHEEICDGERAVWSYESVRG